MEARLLGLFFTLYRFARGLRAGMDDPEFRALLFLTVIVLVSGTAFYASSEGWSVLDALYFSVITLTTVGYGDLHPTTAFSKVFTIFYILVGIGLLGGFIGKLAAGVGLSSRWGHRSSAASDLETPQGTAPPARKGFGAPDREEP